MRNTTPSDTALLEKFYPWAIIFLSALFLFYKYIMQVYPSVITSQLMRTFHVDGAGLGNLAATFFYSYMLTQIFVGVLLDRFSPRILTSVAILCCAIGTSIFSQADTLTLAIISRMLMGVGAAFATVSYVKMAANWFSVKNFAFVTGLMATAAMVGALFGEAPMSWLFQQIGWRHGLLAWGVIGVITAILFFVVVRDKPDSGPLLQQHSYPFSFRDLKTILTSKQNWLLTFYSGLSFAPIAVLGGLWGPPFIREAYHLSDTKAAALVSMSFFGLAIGAPLIGFITDRVKNRRTLMVIGSLISLFSVIAVIYISNLPEVLIGALFLIFGLSVSTFMLGFTIGKEINPLPLAATVIALINTGDAIFGAVTEPLIGKLLDNGWKGKLIDQAHYFGVTDFRHALIILPIYLLIAVVLVFFIKANKNENQKQ